MPAPRRASRPATSRGRLFDLSVTLVISAMLCAIVAVTPEAASPPGPDSDGDGIPDYWEVLYGLNPLDPADALLDPDGDGITNLLEYYLGGNPTGADRSILPCLGRHPTA